ncbi:hypothetical protein GYA27_00990 [candidate division WWE3 bacterium]|uniref:Uncharacterized protein n=1 Tax=candidate division WWE3 bacterium TaxID=2053526 RepID=A0A7X9DJW3_UNCKA|nr:hypothetical protein [candidate division WWE3 bacterium]
MTHMGGVMIHYSGQEALRVRGELYTFADENEARLMNASRENLRKNGSWLGFHIALVNITNKSSFLLIPDSELARTNWRGPKVLPYEQGFLRVAVGCVAILAVLTAAFNVL